MSKADVIREPTAAERRVAKAIVEARLQGFNSGWLARGVSLRLPSAEVLASEIDARGADNEDVLAYLRHVLAAIRRLRKRGSR